MKTSADTTDDDRFSIDQIDQITEQLRLAISDGDGARVRGYLSEVHPADIALLLESVPPTERHFAWNGVPLDLAGEVLSELHEGVRDELIDHMDREHLLFAIRFLDVDDQVRLNK